MSQFLVETEFEAASQGVEGLDDLVEPGDGFGLFGFDLVELFEDTFWSEKLVLRGDEGVSEERGVEVGFAGDVGGLVGVVGSEGFGGGADGLSGGLDLEEGAGGGDGVVEDVAGGVAGGLDEAFLGDGADASGTVDQFFADLDDEFGKLLKGADGDDGFFLAFGEGFGGERG